MVSFSLCSPSIRTAFLTLSLWYCLYMCVHTRIRFLKMLFSLFVLSTQEEENELNATHFFSSVLAPRALSTPQWSWPFYWILKSKWEWEALSHIHKYHELAMNQLHSNYWFDASHPTSVEGFSRLKILNTFDNLFVIQMIYFYSFVGFQNRLQIFNWTVNS